MLQIRTPAVEALSRCRDPASVSWKKVKEEIVAAAQALVEATNQARPPVRLQPIAKLRRVYRVEMFGGEEAPEAVLVPTIEGFTVRVNPKVSRVRQRFSVAHEIGHTFFYDLGSPRPTRLFDHGRSTITGRKEEDICSTFARAILLPEPWLAKEVSLYKSGGAALLFKQLGGMFQVSVSVVARRVIHDLSEFSRCVFLEFDQRWLESHDKRNPHVVLGKSLKSPRSRERAILASVKRAITDPSPADKLSRLARLNAEVATIDWILREKKIQVFIVFGESDSLGR